MFYSSGTLFLRYFFSSFSINDRKANAGFCVNGRYYCARKNEILASERGAAEEHLRSIKE